MAGTALSPLSKRRLLGLDRSGPPPAQTRSDQPLHPWTIPNAIGFLRLALIPVFLVVALSSPHGTFRINGSVKGAAIKFGAVGVGALYSGSVGRSGLTMSGRWTSGPGGGTWKAHKLKS